MQTEEYERMYRLEDSYWWFVGRHDLVLGFVGEAFGERKDLMILDIGCGTGAMSKKLAPWGTVVSADFSPIALAFSRRRQLNLLCASDAMRLPFQDESFDLVVAMDILEHVRDDAAALSEIHRVLKRGGRVIATVPAYQALWSSHDVALMHFRRYAAREVRERFAGAGLRPQRLSYAMTFLYPAVWLARRLFWRDTERPRASLVEVPGWVNTALVRVLSAENALVRRLTLPFGVSVFCMAERA